MFINEEILERGKDPRALFVFLHCQRTGGSNFQRWLVSALGEDRCFTRDNENYAQWHTIEDFSVFDGKSLFGGFSYFKLHEMGRPLVFLANVRHPAYRIISLTSLAKRKESHFLHDFATLPSEEFYKNARKTKDWYIDELQSKRLAGGKVNGKLAIENIKNHFGLVTETDNLSAASAFLADYYGWDIDPIPPLNAPVDAERYASRIDKKLLKKINGNNKDDLKVYEFVASQPALEKRQTMKKVEPVTKGNLTIDDTHANSSREDNPHTGYSAYFMERVANSIAQGRPHNTLGSNLMRDGESRGDFWAAGEAKANRFMKFLKMPRPDAKVVDYGCGSLRLGAHFMRDLSSGSYMGLDVAEGLLNVGKELVGDEIVSDKKPTLRTISPDSIDEAMKFGADGVFSSAVCVHVHPDELAFYFDSLKKIASKPGCRLVFDATLAEESVRYANRSWAWEEDYLVSQLEGLDLIKTHKGKWRERNGINMSITTFEFQRPMK